MKKVLLFFIFCTFLISGQAQITKSLFKKDKKGVELDSSQTSAKDASGKGLSNETIANGLKEALEIGIEKGTTKLASVDGFLKMLP